MNPIPRAAEHILRQAIPGYHQYILSAPMRLDYVSDNLCAMTGFCAEELLADYTVCIHPADREGYAGFLARLGEGTAQTSHYRMVRRDGTVLHVRDTITPTQLPDGTLVGDSVLSDITELTWQNENLRFLNDTMPCGFLKYTCGKTPRVTYLNDRMKQILGIPPDADPALYGDNVYMMIPMEDRRRFSVYLDRVSRHGGPIAGEMTVLRADGTRACLFGWVTRALNDRGEPEFQSACMDITERHHIKKERERARYLKALTEVYDKIFEYDLTNRTVKCLHSSGSPMFRWIENVPMQMEDATDKWILANVVSADRERVRSFFADFYQKKLSKAGPQILRYRALSSDGRERGYMGLFVRLDESVSLFCCRAADAGDSVPEGSASMADFSEHMQELVLRFTDGLAAFEILGDVVTPLYASDNVCDFFGFSREEWLRVMKQRTPIREFVSRSRGDYADFMELLEKGEAEFSYRDLGSGCERRIKAICSRRTPGDQGPRYVMLYSLDRPGRESESRIRIRTFGYFDVFVDGRPIAFRNEKSKELFALLVDRRGGFVTPEEAIAHLWEDESANPVTLARYRKVALRLKNMLLEHGAAEIVESVNGKRRVVTDKVRCDLYDYLSGRSEYAGLFKGSYMSNYSWGERTLAELSGGNLY